MSILNLYMLLEMSIIHISYAFEASWCNNKPHELDLKKKKKYSMSTLKIHTVRCRKLAIIVCGSWPFTMLICCTRAYPFFSAEGLHFFFRKLFITYALKEFSMIKIHTKQFLFTGYKFYDFYYVCGIMEKITWCIFR